ncbi:hypothetical protein [Thiolapillus brandeum]|uniref:Uncharacterized protein n=1 Tax=Thiolapillus brandeum TaxID=1076588 RepID=A0A7U6GHL6_9GAMM|nr:hypothetical protein [Thiolapillus brandeum]BAO43788.1 hypothetical protein TBH_C0854 [Thiolapillus brandeum]
MNPKRILISLSGSGKSIVFRPQNASIHCGRAEADDVYISLPGKIVHTDFLGSIVRYGVLVVRERILALAG